jgi:hypothetical protein
MFIRILLLLSLVGLLSACSSSGLRTTVPPEQLPDCEKNATTSIDAKQSKGTVKTLFIHPGLMLLIDWGGDRALDVGQYWVEQGLVPRLFELRSREQAPMVERMLEDGGGEFVGLHYSMGGSPSVLKKALNAAELVTQKTGVMSQYTAVMVDPFGLQVMEQRIDLDSPYLREVYIVLSGQFSSLRPDPSALSEDFKQHPKVHMLYAEEFGVDWNHFSFLSDVRNSRRDSFESNRSRQIFDAITQGVFHFQSSSLNRLRFHNLKLQYASQDGRDFIPGMCRLLLVNSPFFRSKFFI